MLAVLYFAYTKFIKNWIAGIVGVAPGELLKKEVESVKTISAAVSSPSSTLSDFWTSLTSEYISPEQYRENIAQIQAELAGKKI